MTTRNNNYRRNKSLRKVLKNQLLIRIRPRKKSQYPPLSCLRRNLKSKTKTKTRNSKDLMISKAKRSKKLLNSIFLACTVLIFTAMKRWFLIIFLPITSLICTMSLMRGHRRSWFLSVSNKIRQILRSRKRLSLTWRFLSVTQ